ncbi:MAG: precorrin-6A/cobalt-precorrin-6A reductase [Albidovulum sp.]|nr:precorrin-6A/cobalt-precorrin-6A reductase [Albidovulum sp.]
MTESGRKKILVLAGTADARRLCLRLSQLEKVEAIASLAGSTTHPAQYAVPVRTGGFGGSNGLAEELRRSGFTHLVDATHPFATRITGNAISAAADAGVKLARLERPAWRIGRDGTWKSFSDLDSAIKALPCGSRAFAALGSGAIRSPARDALECRSDCYFQVRVAEPVSEDSLPANCCALVARPLPRCLEQERDALSKSSATCLICRNSGGRAGLRKVRAAAQLGIPVYMVERPAAPIAFDSGTVFATAAEVENWISRDVA